MSTELKPIVIQVRRRSFPQRFIRSYRAWRSFGLSRTAALRSAWRISAVLRKLA